MKKNLLLLTFSLISVNILLAQANRPLRYWEAGAFLGTMNYSGEISSGGGIGASLNETRPQVGVFLKRNTSAKFNLNGELAFGQIFANDKNHGIANRGFEVKTNMIWANVGFDYSFKKFGKYFKRNSNSPFIGMGVGVLYYSPRLATGPSFADYDLYPGTDGTYNIRFAFGWKWRISENGIFGLSFNYHTTGTSHLEGFSLKQGVTPADSFYGLRLTLSRGFFET